MTALKQKDRSGANQSDPKNNTIDDSNNIPRSAEKSTENLQKMADLLIGSIKKIVPENNRHGELNNDIRLLRIICTACACSTHGFWEARVNNIIRNCGLVFCKTEMKDAFKGQRRYSTGKIDKDAAAKIMRVTEEQRRRLKLDGIGSIDVEPEEQSEITNILKKRRRRQLRGLPVGQISAAEFSLLAEMHAHPKGDQRSWANSIGKSKSQTNRMISNLSEQKFVEKATSKKNGFSWKLTTAGLAMVVAKPDAEMVRVRPAKCEPQTAGQYGRAAGQSELAAQNYCPSLSASRPSETTSIFNMIDNSEDHLHVPAYLVTEYESVTQEESAEDISKRHVVGASPLKGEAPESLCFNFSDEELERYYIAQDRIIYV